MPDLSHTTIATWVSPILNAVKAFKASEEILQEVGIDADCIHDANQRIPLVKMKQLWELAAQVSNNDCIGLKVVEHATPNTFHALIYASMASGSIRESLQRLIKFGRVVSTASNFELQDSENVVKLILHEGDTQKINNHHAIDAFMYMIVKGARDSVNSNELVMGVKFKRPAPTDQQKHQQAFNCPISFNEDINEITFDKALVDQYIPSGNAELVRINEQILGEYLSRINKNDIVSNIQSTLISLMPKGEVSRESIAHSLGISSRSLHRKLDDLGTNYKTILDDTRKHLALQYIKQSDLPITTIAFQLGFLNSGSFSRSFKSWTGSSPSEYRQAL